MKGLKIILWICAVSCLLGFICAALPWSAIITFYHWSGVQPPFDATTVFLVRLFLATFGMTGIFFVILARNPLNYDAMLLLSAFGLICFGIFYLVGGIRYGLPIWYFSQKSISCAVFGVLILVFRKKAISK